MQVNVKEPNGDQRTHAKDMTVGQVGEVIDTTYTGKHLLRCYNCIVCLENPQDVFMNDCNLAVRVLPANSTITITLSA